MGFLGGIAEGIKEKRERKDQKYADELASQYKQQQLTIDQQRAQAEAARAATDAAAANQKRIGDDSALRARGVDPTTGAYVPLAPNKSDAQTFPNNGGHAPSESDPRYWEGMARQATARAQQFRQAGRTDEAKAADENSKTYLQQAANMQNAQSKSEKTASDIQLSLARVHDIEVTKPTEFNARMREAHEALSARQDMAGASNAAREQIARLYVAQRMAGLDQNAATREAIAQYQAAAAAARTDATNATNVDRSAIAAGTGGGAAPTTVVPPMIFNIGQGGGSGDGGSSLQKYINQLNGGQKPAVTPPNPRNPKPPVVKNNASDPIVAFVLSGAKSNPNADMVAEIKEGMARGKITSAQIPAVIAGLRASNDPRASAVAAAFGGPPAPPPVRGTGVGGTQTSPFPTPFSLQPR